jgi:hypothetical protein
VFEVQALAYEKFIEAPWGFKETSTPQVVFLAARGDLVSNGFNLWKQRSDLSYRDVGPSTTSLSGRMWSPSIRPTRS